MKYTYFLLILLILFTAINCNKTNTNFDIDININITNQYWSTFVFEQVWPATILYNANIHNYNFTNNYFTINKIMAYNDNNEISIWCETLPFNKTSVSNIMEQLTKYWTNFRNDMLLELVYYKYYSCLHNNNIFNDEYKYFDLGLNLRRQYNLYDMLKSNNIVPSNVQYEKKVIEYTIFYKINVMPIIMCDSKGNLESVAICFDKDTKPIFCPSELYELGCSLKYILFPMYK